MKSNKNTTSEIKDYLIKNADALQKKATEHHKEFLGGERFRTEIIQKYQENHIKVVHALANHLLDSDINKNLDVFKELGETLAHDSVKDGLTIEEATDGIIFLKQTVWEGIEKEGFLKKLTIEAFYSITRITGTYVDVVVSKVAFTYHKFYRDLTELQGKQKNEFIGLVSHELKTPVTSVKAFAQVLQNRFSKAGDVSAASLLMKMDTQLDKLTGLIADILDVTKLETGKMQFHKKLFDFNGLVEEICEEMQRTTHKHTIITKLGKTKSIYGDRDRIGQVLINLLTNAIKYSPSADTIIITTKPNKNSILLCITDFGIGIEKEAQKKVFEQFYRESGKNEDTFAGMGLGLYVSSEIIQKHNGEIWVDSEKGKGSTFCFTLPIYEKGEVQYEKKENHNS
jgi:signal transduction histidine kinase